MKKLPKRKQLRLKYYNYANNGCYFITICTKDRKEILSKINVGAGLRTRPAKNINTTNIKTKSQKTDVGAGLRTRPTENIKTKP